MPGKKRGGKRWQWHRAKERASPLARLLKGRATALRGAKVRQAKTEG